ncbi:MAG: anthranilate phosphoribosyltransferase [Peptococcaceae bacterium BICA1-7]|nr:MAG: anthranilate phosphoribosyltransferase [Peptococcaceae bacterium BICA1-7]HBV96925.1 anthranilate phosphoribosyltransferase [Desulfotomaculum sp.]
MEKTDLIREAIHKAVAGLHLDENQAGEVMDIVMEGEASPAQIAALLIALRLKGETVEEITGFARVMRSKATPIRTRHETVVDTCGTGGDGVNTFNISTAAALVVAGCGIPVAKHGNRSVSSRCGSADVLESLGINIGLTPNQKEECLDRIGIAFLFAPSLHGAMKHAAGPRREIGVRTVFNVLGPLTNPAGANAQVLGVYSSDLVPKLAGVLARLGTKGAFVLHGAGGTDEITPVGPAQVCHVSGGKVHSFELDPLELGIKRAPLDSLKGGSPQENASIINSILSGEKGPQRDAVLLNAALALVASENAATIDEALKIARQGIDSGEALKKLKELSDFTSKAAVRKAIS